MLEAMTNSYHLSIAAAAAAVMLFFSLRATKSEMSCLLRFTSFWTET
jgi:hypothetical protein